jgi:FAD:protein FMN transferase
VRRVIDRSKHARSWRQKSVRGLSRAAILIAWLLGASASPGADLHRQVFSEPHMGTLMRITLYAADEEAGAVGARAAFQRIGELNAILSDYDPQSELTRLCRHPPGSAVEVSEDLFEVLFQAQEIAAKTNGAFDSTIGPLIRIWRAARGSGRLPAPGAIAEGKERTGFSNLRLDPDQRTVTLLAPEMQLDLGGIGKGFAADQALKVLRAHGLSRALVAAAGDIALGDPPPGAKGWRIGIASTGSDGAEMTLMVTLNNAAISSSGDTEQFVEIDGVRYSHIVDPATGLGLRERIAVTILAPDATTADALATAVSVMGAERGLALIETLPDVEGLIVRLTETGRETVMSTGFPRH